MDTTIGIGDTVRSYDFEHHKNCYVEGEVVAFEKVEGCQRYKVKTVKKIFSGKDITHKEGVAAFYYPPVNGTPMGLSLSDKKFTDMVEKV